MACQINRSQLQKQSSVDHEDGSDVVDDLSKLQLSSNESQEIIEEDDKNTFQSELYDEYYSLKAKVDLMHERNGKHPVTDDLKEPMLNFIIRTLSSDKPTDCQHLQDCYGFLNTGIFSQILHKNSVETNNESDGVQLSVEWENQDSRARMIMHKLCAFFGLQHNIIGQQYSSTIKIDYDSTAFIDWGCTIEELFRYVELKRALNINDQEDSSPEAKIILKRTSSNRQQSFNSSHNDSRLNNKTYEDRHNRYYQLRKQLFLPQGENVDDLSIKKIQKTVKQMHSMPTHDSNSRDHLMRVKMEAQQRSATTDYEHESNYIDSSLSNSDFMSGDSVVLFQDSTSGISSPSEVIPVMMQYPLSDDTLVYKLVSTKLSTLSAEDNVYIMPPGTNHPSLLINNDGKPFRYKAGAPSVGFWVQSIPLYMSNTNALPEEKVETKEGKGDSANPCLTSQNTDNIKQCNNNNQSSLTLSRPLLPPDSTSLGNSFGPSGCNIQQANLIHMPTGDNVCHGYPPPNFSSVPQQYSRPLVASATQPPQVPTPPINQQSISAIQYFPQLSGSEYVPVPINSANIATLPHNPSMQIGHPHAPAMLSTQHNLQNYFPPGVMPYQTIMMPPSHYLLPSQTPGSLPRYIQPQGYVNQIPMQSLSPTISQAHQQFSVQHIPSAVSYTNSGGQFLMQHPNYMVHGRGNQPRNPRPNRQSNITSNADESQ